MNILAIDPGSTSTKIGILYQGIIRKEKIEHLSEEFLQIPSIPKQEEIRFNCIKQFLIDNGLFELNYDAIVARGGLLKNVEGGVYKVNPEMLNDLKKGVNGEHPANLGGILANSFSKIYNCPAFIVDPPIIDEMWDIAKITGVKGILRKSKFHALNHKEVARQIAKKIGKTYTDCTFIVAHLGGGITIGLHKKGKVVDVNNGLDGDGPFAVERSGSLPVDGLLEFMEKHNLNSKEIIKIVTKNGGIYSHLNTKNMIEVEKQYKEGDRKVKTVFDAFIYNIVKEIGALYAASKGQIDALILTGGLANSSLVINEIKNYTNFIPKTFVIPGEYEIEALIHGALKVLNGEENAKIYK